MLQKKGLIAKRQKSNNLINVNEFFKNVAEVFVKII